MSKATDVTVLYVDYSIGFGGSSKSLSVILHELEGVRKFLYSAQDASLVESLFPGIPVRFFRHRVNHDGRHRFLRRIAGLTRTPLVHKLAAKAYAILDVLAMWLTVVRLVWFIRRHEVDVVHLNNGLSLRDGLVAARIARVPAVVHLRGFNPGPFTRSLVWLVRGDTRMIAVSDAVAEDLRKVVPPDRVVTVYNGVDTKRLIEAERSHRLRTRCELGLEDEEVAVAIFGRVVPWKGQLEFVRAVVEAMRASPAIRGVVVGDGDAEYLRRVRKTVDASGLSDRFLFTGYREDVEALYAASDIVVHASISPEPFGRVVAEAMAAGRPVIAMDAGGPREIIRHGVDGLLVPAADVEALGRAIVELASDAGRRQAFGARARAAACERFSMAASAAGVRAVYDQILKSSAAITQG